jgi:hypothetical protein
MSEHAIGNAKAWLASIVEMIDDLDAKNTAVAKGEHSDDATQAVEDALQRIYESPLSVEVRDGWRQAGTASDPKEGPEEYRILLTTGGPALRIIGEISEHNEPDDDPRLQWQDWGTPWTDYDLSDDERAKVAAYAQQFYFDES